MVASLGETTGLVSIIAQFYRPGLMRAGGRSQIQGDTLVWPLI